MKILDATAGARSIWYQKNLPFVTFIDKRNEKINTLKNGNRLVCKRTWNVKPDVVLDWTKELPFPKEYFDMVVFDPPHKIKNNGQKESILHMKYGFLDPKTYKMDLKKGLSNLFNVLKQNGFFIFKWNEEEISLNEILKLFPYKPLFGTRTGQKNNTHWVLFMKFRYERELKIN